MQREIARAATVYQDEIDQKERIIVGVNDYILENEEIDIPVLKIDARVEKEQIANLNSVKARRDPEAVQSTLEALRAAARTEENTMPRFIACAKAYCTLQEMCDVLREEWGEYVEKPVF